MTDFLEKIKAQQDPLKKLLGHIPGFSGYAERQTRRDADKLLRDTVARRFEEYWKRTTNFQNDLVGSGKIAFVDDVERAAVQLRTFIDKIKMAPRGYAGLFDAIKIQEQELEALYQFDLAFFELGDQIGRALDTLEATLQDDAGLPAAIHNLLELGRLAVTTYDKRTEAVTGQNAEPPPASS